MSHTRAIFTRLAVGLVLAVNLACAAAFLLQPEAYVGGFEVEGLAGQTLVRGMGILFVMWNVPYAALALQPRPQAGLLAVILLQQAIGVAGETWLYFGLPAGHAALRATGLRFILFDAFGLALIGVAMMLMSTKHTK